MKLAWHFNRVNPRFKNREATQGEFFTSDTELRGFIREAVQNSLDAKRSRVRGPVRVRIFISGDKAALSPEKAERYFAGGWDHFHSEGSGLRDAPVVSEPCRFIAYEDSGTTGLTGDVTQYHEVSGVRNPFYYFFRAEGQSNKTEGGRGRWGLGKFVFPRSSRIRSFFGVTVRHDDKKRLLVGQSILRSHNIKDKSFTPDGWFGKKPDRNEASLPVTDQRFINKFLADFRLKRADDPGLSLVVPFCDERWTAAAVTEAIVQDYFYPILRGDLVVTVEETDAKTVLDSQSLNSVVSTCQKSLQQTLRPLMDLTSWALTQMSHTKEESPSTVRVPVRKSPAASRRPAADTTSAGENGPGLLTMSPTCLATSHVPSAEETRTLTELRQLFQSQGRVAVRVPVDVHPKEGLPRTTFFDAFIERAEGSLQKRPLFVRDGIVISDVRTRAIRDVHAIVSINDSPLTVFLGDAENPAHTEWSEESSHFKGKYNNAAATLRTVRNTVADLCQVLTESAGDQDPVLLLDVFSVGTTKGQSGHQVNFPSMSSRGSESSELRLLSLQSQPRKTKPYQVTNRKGGFRVASRTRQTQVCSPLTVQVAYDCRGGSPLRKFSETDFHLKSDTVTISVRNALIQIVQANQLLILPQKREFEVIVTGFDLNRDLFLKTTPKPPSSERLSRAG